MHHSTQQIPIHYNSNAATSTSSRVEMNWIKQTRKWINM